MNSQQPEFRECIEFIENNSVAIIANIQHESIDVYEYIQEQFESSNVVDNHLFQFVYRSFYRIDNAGLTTEFKKEYFKILEATRGDKDVCFQDVVRRLYEIPNTKQQNTVQFSFVTKMLHTINNENPIYDSEIARIFNFKTISVPDYSKKIDIYSHRYDLIKSIYYKIINNHLLENIHLEFDSKFGHNNLKSMKKLDFIFWSAGKVKKIKSNFI